MDAVLTVAVPEELLAKIREQAAAAGKTPEALAAEVLAGSPRFRPNYGSIRRFAGKFHSELTDASVRVDEYITDTMLPPAGGPNHG